MTKFGKKNNSAVQEILSGHERTHGQNYRQMDGWTNKVIPIYPPPPFMVVVVGRGVIKKVHTCQSLLGELENYSVVCKDQHCLTSDSE